MGLLIFFLVLSIVFSFLCSIWEAVLLSITPSYISSKVQEGSAIGTSLQSFKKDIDRPLSAILTLNTIAHTVGAIGVGAQASKVFGATKHIPLGPINLSVEAVIATLMTLAILILSEIIPKTIGANFWRQLAPFTVKSLNILLLVLAPFVWISQLITKNLKNDKSKSVFSRADFRALTQAGEKSGMLRKTESRTINNLLKLDQIEVKDIMTPRSVMKSTSVGTTIGEFYKEKMPLRYSRVPVFDESKDRVLGVMLKDELFIAMINQKANEDIKTLLREPVFINQHEQLTKLQNLFIDTKEHIAMVTDDFGSVLGLVTWEDLVETILGLEIVDESDDVTDLQKLARELWEKRSSRQSS